VCTENSDDHTIKLWDTSSGREVHILGGHSLTVLSVAFSPDGRMLASGSADHTIKLSDVESGREVRTIREHYGNVESISFSQNGRWLASGSWDGTVKLWDISSSSERVALVAFTDGSSLAITTPNDRLRNNRDAVCRDSSRRREKLDRIFVSLRMISYHCDLDRSA
jgi:WD40 repeat protein